MNKWLRFSRRYSSIKTVMALGGLLAICVPWSAAQGAVPEKRLTLDGVVVLVGDHEASFVQYGARDLGKYLTEISGKPVAVATSIDRGRQAKVVIVIGRSMARAMVPDPGPTKNPGNNGFTIRLFNQSNTKVVVVTGADPQGTNMGIATLMQMIRAEGNSAYLDGTLPMEGKPSFALRGIHLNGWPLGYPYGFRSWKEEDWKRFVDIAWAQRANLLFLWPFMEVLPVPLSKEDAAYLQEVRRVVDYAQNQRGMKVWIMQSANRIGVSDCGTRDPRFRTYWVKGCQTDMNPADSQQFGRIVRSFTAFYQTINNADAYCMIDSDPGGWPQSPLSDQVKIFQAARKLLDQYSIHHTSAELVDWMWLGWGRHKFYTSTDAAVAAYDWTSKNPDDSDVQFMEETIRNFKKNLPEPWGLLAGMPRYLDSSKKEATLDKTVYLRYGAIEEEPAFPKTNLGFEPVRTVLEKAVEYPSLKGIMGNNEMVLLQFPRTFYFLASTWNYEYRKRPQQEVLLDLSRELYPDHKEVIADSFLALGEPDPDRIKTTLARLGGQIDKDKLGRPGLIGRYLFPDRLEVARDLQTQLSVRMARQQLLKALQGKPDAAICSKLLENYFDQLLAWNEKTGWNKMIDINIWTAPIYEEGKDLTEAMSRLKQVLGQGSPYTSYAQINTFFEQITRDLAKKHGQNSTMIGCVEPFKLAVIQSQ